MLLTDYKPHSMLVVKSTRVDEPRFPVIDAHNHLAEPFGGGWDKKPVGELIDVLDRARIVTYVDLDGGWGEEVLNRHLDLFKTVAPDRFRIFGGVEWAAWPEHGDHFGEWAANRLRIQAKRGAEGLKIWKPFGLNVRDQHGELVRIDDNRLDPIWETSAELNLPVLIHVADPAAFFNPLDNRNERWEELQIHPDWYFPSPPYPSFESLINSLANLVQLHSNTTFIAAHVGCYSENLGWVANWLERCPNLYVDIAARISELGRQPYTARKFFLKYADRILFGSDFGPDINYYRIYYRFLETDDEYINYSTTEIPLQGRWYIYGMYLPDDVLEKIYFSNAKRVLGLKS
ncbi:MAG TPA: amidohydrolase family protein [Anaerolineaceae bacterium]|nr:amidohydrolase family protein [Anaerolineaceae bacterium]